MKNKKPKLVKIPWIKFSNKFLESLKDLNPLTEMTEIEKRVLAKTRETLGLPSCIIKLTRKKFCDTLSNRNIKRKRVADNLWTRLSEKEKEEFKLIYPNGSSGEIKESIKKTYPNADKDTIFYLAKFAGLKGQRKLKGNASVAGKKKEEEIKKEEKVISQEEVLQNLPLEIRQWDDPEILDITEEEWKKSGVRIGLISGTAFLSGGERCGLVWRGLHDLSKEPTHFNVLVGHLIDKKSFQQKITHYVAEAKIHLHEERKTKKIPTISHKTLTENTASKLIDETAKALAALIPKIRKPHSQWRKLNDKLVPEFVRLYIMTSPIYDGPYGELVAQRLRELRDDVRLMDSEQMEVKGINKMLGVLVPVKNRLPSKYFSTAAEKEIDEKEGQMTKDFPGLWAVGPFAASVFTPNGVRPRPYVMVPALCKLEEVRVAENQVGIMVLEFKSKDDLPIVRLWSYRDLIKNERFFINSPREVTKIQEKIVKILQERGGQSVGLIADHLEEGLTREKIESEIQSLISLQKTNLKSWPGIDYNPQSQKYNFNLNWIQERLRYPEIKNFTEDAMLFFGCLHAGYTTSDTEHFIREMPKIILEHNVRRLFGLGDMIAGLHHDFHHTGEVFGSMNYTEQEIFAAEIVGTVLIKVFSELFEKTIQKRESIDGFSSEELIKITQNCLVNFDFIPGNHDLWQEGEGHTPLKIFYGILTKLLTRHIGHIFLKLNVKFFDLSEVIESCIISHSDYNARVILPSGIRVAMEHPHMGNAQTTSLRAQSAMGLFDSQVTAIANFHTATIVPKWQPDLGQCVVVQVGTQAIYTRFERRKMKRAVGFGPILLKTFSKEGRIIKIESLCKNKPYLQEAISKSTDPVALKKRFNIIF